MVAYLNVKTAIIYIVLHNATLNFKISLVDHKKMDWIV